MNLEHINHFTLKNQTYENNFAMERPLPKPLMWLEISTFSINNSLYTFLPQRIH